MASLEGCSGPCRWTSADRLAKSPAVDGPRVTVDDRWGSRDRARRGTRQNPRCRGLGRHGTVAATLLASVFPLLLRCPEYGCWRASYRTWIARSECSAFGSPPGRTVDTSMSPSQSQRLAMAATICGGIGSRSDIRWPSRLKAEETSNGTSPTPPRVVDTARKIAV
jgi:hypothetical protein